MQGEHQERVGVWAVAEKLLWPLKAGLLPDTPQSAAVSSLAPT